MILAVTSLLIKSQFGFVNKVLLSCVANEWHSLQSTFETFVIKALYKCITSLQCVIINN